MSEDTYKQDTPEEVEKNVAEFERKISLSEREDRLDLYNKILKGANNGVRIFKGQELSEVNSGDFISKALDNPDPIIGISDEDSWKNWKKAREAQGWTYGVYDQEAKTHPNLVENYSDLDSTEQFKDSLAKEMIRVFCRLEHRLTNRT